MYRLTTCVAPDNCSFEIHLVSYRIAIRSRILFGRRRIDDWLYSWRGSVLQLVFLYLWKLISSVWIFVRRLLVDKPFLYLSWLIVEFVVIKLLLSYCQVVFIYFVICYLLFVVVKLLLLSCCYSRSCGEWFNVKCSFQIMVIQSK